ncbi:hypothetical protein WICMUC_002651 [Wickerhamomyces mucosus]|uniref:Protein IVY1 n=1 Tax=Wickerhamomyces mucosus TaxID=1378264 RepID=A0A9P8PP96_9ASCO|nr:hypothetical protein WICMUC_002651 [Wickerhamomyces mucosus]
MNSDQISPKSEHSRATQSPTRYSKASHLTEFYPYLNGSLNIDTIPKINNPPSRNLSFSTSTANSTYTSFTPSLISYNNNKLISKNEINETLETFEEVIQSSKEYRDALNKLNEASNKFGASLGKVSKLKGLEDNADGFLTASGLFYLIGNHQQIISHNIKTNFEDSIEQEIAKVKSKLNLNEDNFKINYKKLIKILKIQELENLKLTKSKNRNLLNYKNKLLQLTSNIDEIDRLKHEFYTNSHELINDSSNHILEKLSSIVRAQVEIYESIAKKGWSGNGLDDLISRGPDPFLIDEEDDEEDDNNNNDNDNDYVEEEDQDIKSIVNSTIDGLIFNDNNKVFIPEPIVTTTVNTFKPESIYSSTPIRENFKNLANFNNIGNNDINHNADNNNNIKSDYNNDDNNKQDDEGDETLEPIDDNSFSLPIPGSSGKTSVNDK